MGLKMQIVPIDFEKISLKSSILVFTTNGNIKKNGRAVMGRGIAKWVKDNLFFSCDGKIWTKPDILLGKLLKENGNRVYSFIAFKKGMKPEDYFMALSFPTKHNWWEKSDTKLILQSANQTVEILQNVKPYFKKVFLPVFGTENGKLTLEEVRPILEQLVFELQQLGFEVIVFKRKKLTR